MHLIHPPVHNAANQSECRNAATNKPCVATVRQTTGGGGRRTPRFWMPTTPPTNCWPEAPLGGRGGSRRGKGGGGGFGFGFGFGRHSACGLGRAAVHTRPKAWECNVILVSLCSVRPSLCFVQFALFCLELSMPLPLTWLCICHKRPHSGRPLLELNVVHHRQHIHMVVRYGCLVIRVSGHGHDTGAAPRHSVENAQRSPQVESPWGVHSPQGPTPSGPMTGAPEPGGR